VLSSENMFCVCVRVCAHVWKAWVNDVDGVKMAQKNGNHRAQARDQRPERHGDQRHGDVMDDARERGIAALFTSERRSPIYAMHTTALHNITERPGALSVGCDLISNLC